MQQGTKNIKRLQDFHLLSHAGLKTQMPAQGLVQATLKLDLEMLNCQFCTNGTMHVGFTQQEEVQETKKQRERTVLLVTTLLMALRYSGINIPSFKI